MRAKAVKAVLIDPARRLVEEVLVTSDPSSLLRQLECVQSFALQIDSAHFLVVNHDDIEQGSGLRHAFMLPNSTRPDTPFFCKALIVGVSDVTKYSDHILDLDFLRREIEWLGRCVHFQGETIPAEKLH